MIISRRTLLAILLCAYFSTEKTLVHAMENMENVTTPLHNHINAQQPSSEEILDLVDADDQVIGCMARSEVYKQKKHNFRVINGFIRNKRGLLWIPRRSASKKLYPLALDASVGGHVKSGENYDQAFRRETAEELNIDTTAVTYRYLGSLTPHQHNVSAFMQVYEITMNCEPSYNHEDFSEFQWISPKDLYDLLKADEPAKSDLILLIEHLYLH